MQVEERDKKVYFTLRKLLGKMLCRMFGYSAPMLETNCGPMLVVSNHNSDFDPVFLGMSFRQHLYFVASEHMFRMGLAGKILVNWFHPIARKKGMTDAASAMQIMRSLRQGNHVCLFAEGNRSFNGVTGPVFPATGKLARAAKASLVTFRLKGDYMATPRWALFRRHGKIKGELVRIYTNEELRRMSDEEIQRAIEQDLHEDAFERQLTEKQIFKGKRLAEGLENALYICPKCGAVGTLKGKGNVFQCECGLRVEYGDNGFFKGQDIPFTTVRDWDAWQTDRAQTIASEALNTPDTPVYTDEDMVLLRLDAQHGMTVVAKGTLTACDNGLTVGETTLPFDTVSDMAIVGRHNIVFSAANESYEIRSSKKKQWCGRKYHTYYTLRKQLHSR